MYCRGGGVVWYSQCSKCFYFSYIPYWYECIPKVVFMIITAICCGYFHYLGNICELVDERWEGNCFCVWYDPFSFKRETESQQLSYVSNAWAGKAVTAGRQIGQGPLVKALPYCAVTVWLVVFSFALSSPFWCVYFLQVISSIFHSKVCMYAALDVQGGRK